MEKAFNILVTGSGGQLGNEIQEESKYYFDYNFIFLKKNQLDISDKNSLRSIILKHQVNHIINCAAYTNVNEAEIDKKNADLINSISLSKMSELCKKNNVKLIHISTDYVFDGETKTSYNENDETNPINYYGKSKLEGEKIIQQKQLKNSLIIRTSWLYSKNKDNFVSNIINKIKLEKEFLVTKNESSSPTSAKDLAKVILEIIPKINNEKTEVYHYSNSGLCSRYNLALEINRLMDKNIYVKPSNFVSKFPRRPKLSQLNCKKIVSDFDIKLSDWKSSLKNHIFQIKSKNEI